MDRIWPQTVGWTMPGLEPGPVWWRDLSGKVTRSEVQRFGQSWDALEGIQDVNIIIVLLLSFITKQTVWIHHRIFFFFNSVIVQKSSSHMFNQSAVESCRCVGDEEDGAESPGMFDWFFNVFLFFLVFTCQGTKRNFSHTTGWRCSLSLTAPGGRPLHSRALWRLHRPIVSWGSCDRRHTHTHTQDAGLLQRPLPPSGRTHRQAELSLLFLGGGRGWGRAGPAPSADEQIGWNHLWADFLFSPSYRRGWK